MCMSLAPSFFMNTVGWGGRVWSRRGDWGGVWDHPARGVTHPFISALTLFALHHPVTSVYHLLGCYQTIMNMYMVIVASLLVWFSKFESYYKVANIFHQFFQICYNFKSISKSLLLVEVKWMCNNWLLMNIEVQDGINIIYCNVYSFKFR